MKRMIIGLAIVLCCVMGCKEKTVSTPKKELLIGILSGIAKDINEDYPATSGVLYLLCGSLYSGQHEEDTIKLMGYLAPFAVYELQRLKELQMQQKGAKRL